MKIASQIKKLAPEAFGYSSPVSPGYFTFAPAGATFMQFNIFEDLRVKLEALCSEPFKFLENSNLYEAAVNDAKYCKLLTKYNDEFGFVLVYLVKKS